MPVGGGGGGGGGNISTNGVNGGNIVANNIISYKSDRLTLPEYDYSMTPADIIRFSNQNFDYERYIRDWVVPYSNSAYYIRRYTDEALVVSNGTQSLCTPTSLRPFAISNIENTYYQNVPENDYANYYKSVGNITKVDVKSDEHRPVPKKPSSTTLEYLDLSDRSPPGKILFEYFFFTLKQAFYIS